MNLSQFSYSSSRGTESVETLNKRLARADEEMKFADSGAMQFDLVLVNDDLEETIILLLVMISRQLLT